MRKIIFIISLTMSFAYGCTIDEQLDSKNANSTVFTASFENFRTKVYIDGALNTRWNADDRISVFMSTYNSQYMFVGNDGDDNGIFSEVGSSFTTGAEIPTNYAVYPYKSTTSISTSGTISLILPCEQLYAENSYGSGANTMIAVTESSSSKFLKFKSVCGFLIINLYGEAKIRSIDLEGNNEEKLSGNAIVVPSYAEAPYLSMCDDATERITLDCGEGVQLGNSPETYTSFWIVVPPVTFSNGFTVTFTNDKGEVMSKSALKSKTITRNVVNNMTPLEVVFGSTKETVPEAVDLGLSVNWGSFNIGASKPEEYGNYYAWGETETKDNYGWNNYKWCNGSANTQTKYNTKSYWGLVDNIATLEMSDDVAHTLLGNTWRMPTEDEFLELKDNCLSEWTTWNGVYGIMFTSKINGNSIFFPAAGINYNSISYSQHYGFYWSSTLSVDYPVNPICLTIDYNGDIRVFNSHDDRCYGQSVRPVCDK